MYTDPPDSDSDCTEARRTISELFKRSSTLITALGDETRQGIIVALLDAEQVGLRVGTITEMTRLSRPAVSHHLKILKDAGAVSVRKRGTMNFYYIDASTDAWKGFWQLSDTVRNVAQRAHYRGYPDRSERQ